MNFQTVINRMLSPIEIDGVTYLPSVTWSNSTRQGFNARRGDSAYHNGVDFNYSGVGQNGINLTNPDVFSPIDGTVIRVDPVKYGQIIIKDSMGYEHTITHLDSLSGFRKGDKINAGDLIGTMGGRGPLGPNQYDQHIDYKIKNPKGKPIDPEALWNYAGKNSYWPSPYDQEYGPYVPGPFYPAPEKNPWIFDVDPFKALYEASIVVRHRDPLILDLDGDGVETINVKDGAYFDHDGNGFAEQTGWASSDDGLLVMDRNSDGIINDGKELFGDQMKLMDDGRPPAMAGWDDGREKQMIEKTIVDCGFKTLHTSRVIPLRRDRQHHGFIDWLDVSIDIHSHRNICFPLPMFIQNIERRSKDEAQYYKSN